MSAELALLGELCAPERAHMHLRIAQVLRYVKDPAMRAAVALQLQARKRHGSTYSFEVLLRRLELSSTVRAALTTYVMPELLGSDADVVDVVESVRMEQRVRATKAALRGTLDAVNAGTLTSADLGKLAQQAREIHVATTDVTRVPPRVLCVETVEACMRSAYASMRPRPAEDLIPLPWDTLTAFTGGHKAGDHWVGGGIPRGSVMIVGAGSGVGKSIVSTYLAAHAYRNGRSVAVWNGENDLQTQTQRETAALTKMSKYEVLNDADRFRREYRAATTMAQHARWVTINAQDPQHESAPWTMDRIEEALGDAQLDLFVADYLMLMRPNREMSANASKTEIAMAIRDDIQDFGRRRKCAVLILSQMSKGGDYAWSSELINPAFLSLVLTRDKGAVYMTVDVRKLRQPDYDPNSEAAFDKDMFFIDAAPMCFGRVHFPQTPDEITKQILAEREEAIKPKGKAK